MTLGRTLYMTNHTFPAARTFKLVLDRRYEVMIQINVTEIEQTLLLLFLYNIIYRFTDYYKLKLHFSWHAKSIQNCPLKNNYS